MSLVENRDHKSPGTFSVELNNAHKDNNLPTIIVPGATNTVMQAQHQTETGTTSLQPQPAKRKDSLSRTNSTNDLNISQESLTPKKVINDAKELGLEFFTLKERGWPENFNI